VPEQLLDEPADGDQHIHVHQQVHDADVDEHGGEQAPPLAVRHERTELGAPADQIGAARRHARRAARHQDDEHDNVGGDQGPRRGGARHRVTVADHPEWRGALASVIRPRLACRTRYFHGRRVTPMM